MKYALITDNNVQWFSYIVAISSTGEAIEWYQLDNDIHNEYLNNLFNRETSFSDLRIYITGQPVNSFYGGFISEYEFKRVRRMIELFKYVEEYNKLGKL